MNPSVEVQYRTVGAAAEATINWKYSTSLQVICIVHCALYVKVKKIIITHKGNKN